MTEQGFGGLPSWARKGQRVVCVDASASQRHGACPLTEGAVYTLREVININDYRTTPYPGPSPIGFRLEEVTGIMEPRTVAGVWEVPFPMRRFRPVKTQEDDLREHFEVYLKDDHRAPEKAAA